MTEYVQVMTTVDDEDEGMRLAQSITEARLAACVQISSPIRSVYWWEGKLERAQEYQLFIKTAMDRVAALEEHIKANHSYDVPEIVVTPILGGNAFYLEWINAETRQTGASS